MAVVLLLAGSAIAFVSPEHSGEEQGTGAFPPAPCTRRVFRRPALMDGLVSPSMSFALWLLQGQAILWTQPETLQAKHRFVLVCH